MKRWERALLLLAALLVLPGCGGRGGIAEVDLLVTVSAGKANVRTGEGFPITVTRVWRRDIEPSPWDDGVLSPLVVRAGSVTRREDRLRIEETRTFRAHAFSLKDVTIPPVLFLGRSIGGSGRLVTRSAAVPLTITPVLDPEAPGLPELPLVPPRPSPAWPYALVLIVLLLGLAGWLVRRGLARRVRAAPPSDTADLRTPEERALARLAANREGDLSEVAETLRGYTGARLAIPAAVWTSAEIVAAAPRAQAGVLDSVLTACDLVKFAAHVPAPEEAARVLEQASAFVRACGSARP